MAVLSLVSLTLGIQLHREALMQSEREGEHGVDHISMIITARKKCGCDYENGMSLHTISTVYPTYMFTWPKLEMPI